MTTDIRVHSALVTRIKVMANMNIAEKRVPQDGKVGVTIDNRQIDLRIASMPTTHGEKLVIRVLDRAAFFVGKQNLGFSVEDAAKFDRLVNRPWGLVLVTGPTGSGKPPPFIRCWRRWMLIGSIYPPWRTRWSMK